MHHHLTRKNPEKKVKSFSGFSCQSMRQPLLMQGVIGDDSLDKNIFRMGKVFVSD